MNVIEVRVQPRLTPGTLIPIHLEELVVLVIAAREFVSYYKETGKHRKEATEGEHTLTLALRARHLPST